MKIASLSAISVLALSIGMGQIVSKVVDKVDHSLEMHRVQLCHAVPEGWTTEAYGNALLYEWRNHGPIYVACAGGRVRLAFT